ncbi:MAG: toxin-antitoxin system YwqK family antitoxin [Cytophaga sp.]|uniref:toxin-antitoxin system YwqK family antitoxin n=1 Tax=Cytophaga sp. TaxID=29535 RepID=UPI003F7F667A
MKQFFYVRFFFLGIFLLPLLSVAQTDTLLPSGKKPRYYIMETDTTPQLIFIPDTLHTKKKHKAPKPKKKVFYDLKCKKGFIRTISGAGSGNVTMEFFYYLKVWKDPNPYIPDIYVWDITKNKIIKVSKIEADKQPNYRVLHGPYKKEVNGNVIETGAFYVGTKHARWELYDKNFTLLAKTKYYKGWPKEAKITYFDAEHRRPKEVMPYEYGKLQGDYYLFTDKGNVLMKGQYENGAKVGVWIEFFPDSPNRKRETKYPDDPYDKETQPVIAKEWNEKGKVIIIDGKPIPEGSKEQQEDDPIKKRLKRKK